MEMGVRGFISCGAGQERPNVLGPSAIPDGSSSATSEDWIHDRIRVAGGKLRRKALTAVEARSLNKAGIRKLSEIGNLLDDADLKQQIGRFLVECVELTSEEGLVGSLILPTQVFR